MSERIQKELSLQSLLNILPEIIYQQYNYILNTPKISPSIDFTGLFLLKTIRKQ